MTNRSARDRVSQQELHRFLSGGEYSSFRFRNPIIAAECTVQQAKQVQRDEQRSMSTTPQPSVRSRPRTPRSRTGSRPTSRPGTPRSRLTTGGLPSPTPMSRAGSSASLRRPAPLSVTRDHVVLQAAGERATPYQVPSSPFSVMGIKPLTPRPTTPGVVTPRAHPLGHGTNMLEQQDSPAATPRAGNDMNLVVGQTLTNPLAERQRERTVNLHRNVWHPSGGTPNLYRGRSF